MPLQRLNTYQFRNLQDVDIVLDNHIQVIYGDNASGKTSLLEAMHVLCSAKSFLGVTPKKLQQFDTSDFSLNGHIIENKGITTKLQYKWKNSVIQLKAGFNSVSRTSQYALLQPVQAITPASFRLIDDIPEFRRKFIDWGVFHVKHEYIQDWHKYQRALVQRNIMLNQAADRQSLLAWSHEYAKLSDTIDQHRLAYINDLIPVIQQSLVRILPEVSITLDYHRGWDPHKELMSLLEESLDRDLERGYTIYGPQRAELQIKINGHIAKDTASRGQKKLITYAMYLSQAQLQQQIGNHSGLLLIDDLPSELDSHHQEVVLELLCNLPMQVVISCIETKQLKQIMNSASKLFHVKQGMVKEVIQ